MRELTSNEMRNISAGLTSVQVGLIAGCSVGGLIFMTTAPLSVCTLTLCPATLNIIVGVSVFAGAWVGVLSGVIHSGVT